MHLWAGNGRVNGDTHSKYFYGYVDTTKSYNDAGSYASTLSGNRRGTSRTLGGSQTVFEPQDADKGDIARAIFYMAARYNYLSGSDSDGIDAGNPNLEIVNALKTDTNSYDSTTTKTGKMGILQDLLEWNRMDPPDSWEIHRNNLLYNNFTNNRNPFIDFPEWAEYIWGTCTNGSYNSASTGYAIPSGDNINEFGNVGDIPKVNSVTVSPSYVELDLNGTTTKNLTASVSVSNGAPQTVNWSSSNTSVATVSSSGVVTAVGVGTCTINATSTFNSGKKGTAEIKVRNTGGSVIEDDYTFDLTIASYDNNPSEELVTWTSNNFTMTNERNGSSNTKVNNYLGGDSNNRTSSRMYKNNLLTITPLDDYEITSIVFNSTSDNYATALNSSTWTNATSSVLGSVVTVVPTDGEEEIKATIGGTCGFTSIKINYKYYSGLPVVTLTDISLDTRDVQTVFTVGDAFNYNNLVVTANYSDNSHSTIGNGDFTITSPDMSKSGNKTITVTYEGKSASYSITVDDPVASSITATVSETFHPGDMIITSDIYVEDNLGNEVVDFDFADEEYQFTYDDAPSGGGVAVKTFANAVSYGNLTCDVSVNVSRESYEEIITKTDNMTQSWTGGDGTKYLDWTGELDAGITYKGNSAGPSTGYIQMRSKDNSGIVATNSSDNYIATAISVSWQTSTPNGKKLEVYGKHTAYSAPSDLYNDSTKGTFIGTLSYNEPDTSASLELSGSYEFIGLKSENGAIYLNRISISYDCCKNDAKNITNYIMYSDTDGQCETKFDNVIDCFETMSSSDIAEFMTSDDYTIATARERFLAWARHENVQVTYSNGEYVFSKLNPLYGFSGENLYADNSNSMIIILVVCSVGVGALSILYLHKKRKQSL